MSEQDANVAEQETPSEEDLAAQALVEAEGEDAPEEQDELEETEFDGKKVKVTKGFKDALLREQDYRHKTHAAAERERAAEAKERAVEERAQIQAKFFEEFAERKTVAAELEKMDAYTPEQWAAYEEVNGEKATRLLERQHSQLRTRLQKLDGTLQEKINNERAEQSRRQTEFNARNEQELKTKIKDWSPEKEKTLKSHVAERFGFDARELQDVKDPRIMAVLDYLHRQDSAIAKARAKAAAAKNEAETVEITPPAKVKGGNGNLGRGPTPALLKHNPAAFDREIDKLIGRKH